MSEPEVVLEELSPYGNLEAIIERFPSSWPLHMIGSRTDKEPYVEPVLSILPLACQRSCPRLPAVSLSNGSGIKRERKRC